MPAEPPDVAHPLSAATLSQRLAQFAQDLELSDIPRDVVETARYCILDALGIGLAASTFGFAQRSAAGITALAEACTTLAVCVSS